MIGNIYYKGNLLVIWQYLIEKRYIWLYQWGKYNKVPYLCIYDKLIDIWFRIYMSCDAIIICHKEMTGNIYYHRISQGSWDYLIEIAILDCINEKKVRNFLISHWKSYISLYQREKCIKLPKQEIYITKGIYKSFEIISLKKLYYTVSMRK